MSSYRCALAALAVILTLVAGVPAARADVKFPSRPITLINPFTPGGPIDIHLRGLVPQAEKVFGVSVVVDNKPGASGTLGPATMAATAKPDGYTLSEIGTSVLLLPLQQKTTFDTLKDFTYIINLSSYRYIIVVHKDSPWKTWNDFVADAKKNPGKLSYGSFGTNGTIHLATEQLATKLGVKFTHVPMRGASEQVAGLMGKHIDFAPTGGLGYQMVEQGQFRALLSFTAGKNPRYPDLPTFADIGVKIDIDVTTPYGIAGPKGMDPKIVQILHDGFKKASEMPASLAVIKKLEQDYAYLSSADYTASIKQQIEAYRKALDAMGITKK
jgi:tripartite-type tricarboxylate transporter receptor subunit TctC